jgi:hypothetical protein
VAKQVVRMPATGQATLQRQSAALPDFQQKGTFAIRLR